MEPHRLKAFTEAFVEKHGVPRVLDVDQSIHVHKPTLTGSDSPASYYIRPPFGMTADELIEWFESTPRYRDYKLTMVPILGLDTYHQPLISVDEFAKKYFNDNHERIVRVTGKLDSAVEAMAAFVEALKQPFDAKIFPQLEDFTVSRYKAPEEGRATEVRLLFKPADHTQLMKVERLVSVHLDECNLGREIVTSRHWTRDQPPELMLTSTGSTPAGVAFLEALSNSLPHATPEEVVNATEFAKRSHAQAAPAPTPQARFTQPKVPTMALPANELKKRVIAILAEVLKAGNFANGAEVKIVQAGTTIEVAFPRSPSSLWLASTFREATHIKEVANFCGGVRTDPQYREGWSGVYNFDKSTGKLHIRALETGAEPPSGWKTIPR